MKFILMMVILSFRHRGLGRAAMSGNPGLGNSSRLGNYSSNRQIVAQESILRSELWC